MVDLSAGRMFSLGYSGHQLFDVSLSMVESIFLFLFFLFLRGTSCLELDPLLTVYYFGLVMISCALLLGNGRYFVCLTLMNFCVLLGVFCAREFAGNFLTLKYAV